MGIRLDSDASFWIPLFGRCEEGYMRTHSRGPSFSVSKCHDGYGKTSFSIQFGQTSARAWAHARLPSTGTPGHGMLLCQPPVKRAVVRLYCFHEWKGGCRGAVTSNALRRSIDWNTGLTIGDISDAIGILRETHRTRKDDIWNGTWVKLPAATVSFDSLLTEDSFLEMLWGEEKKK